VEEVKERRRKARRKNEAGPEAVGESEVAAALDVVLLMLRQEGVITISAGKAKGRVLGMALGVGGKRGWLTPVLGGWRLTEKGKLAAKELAGRTLLYEVKADGKG
jgi:hypothetical protein